MKLSNILNKAKLIRAREMGRAAGFHIRDNMTPIEMLRATGIEIPDNPTIDDFRRAAAQIGQNAKEVMNTQRPWSDEHWREISKAIEKLERNK